MARNITVETLSGKQNIKCPLHPFALNASLSFITSDGILDHKAYNLTKLSEVLIDTKIDVSDHHQSHLVDEGNKNWELMDSLVEKQKHLIEQNTLIGIGDRRITYKHASYFSFPTILFLLIILLLWLLTRGDYGTSRRNIVELRSMQTQTSPDLTIYGSRLASLRSRLSS